ncbi:MAG TPA: hypothetical protein VFY20_01235 [Gemmatimonadales bacterium]|nr:hypothetical protein [Gemmatimonadales bacterium]
MRPALLALALTLVACDDDNTGPVPAAPEDYPFAYATNSCGPTDGPATRLYLSAEVSDSLPLVAPRVEVLVYRSAADLQGEEFSWSGYSEEGWAGRCAGDAPCEEASSVAVEFRRNAADTVLTGEVRVRFPDGSTVSGGFDATWRRTTYLCG